MIKLDLIIGGSVYVSHPCDSFARRAGYRDWRAAMEAMKSGKVLTATPPTIGKTMFEFTNFLSQLRKEGLFWATDLAEQGFFHVGYKQHFPPDLLQEMERRIQAMYERIAKSA